MEKTLKKIILITARYPYEEGEQFLETEINYYKNKDITILPKFASEKIRDTPSQIKVDTFLIEKNPKQIKLKYLRKMFFSLPVYKAFFSESFRYFEKFKMFLSASYRYMMYYEKFDKYFASLNDTSQIVVYTYWHDVSTYALQSLKKKYKYKLVSRIHGSDLYQERQKFNYMPLKREFTQNIDTIFTITDSANIYLEKTYGFSPDILKVSRLGVRDRGIVAKASGNNMLFILSCSFLIEVKQIDKLIYAIKQLAIKRNDIFLSWKHIGDGVLFKPLTELAKQELYPLENVSYTLLGNYTNEKVYHFYAHNPVDVFVNVSASEGVPVSIMEAMSCHVPIVAPNVGGIKDMIVDGKNGYLLHEKCSPDEVANVLQNIHFFKNKDTRENAYRVFVEKYNAEKNYVNFVKNIST